MLDRLTSCFARRTGSLRSGRGRVAQRVASEFDRHSFVETLEPRALFSAVGITLTGEVVNPTNHGLLLPAVDVTTQPVLLLPAVAGELLPAVDGALLPAVDGALLPAV